ncbi:HPr family phosphocarrier protein [Pseudarthrobacter sp. S9]|uniref:HPr family phosphocarrier protein n=1 Tax=Pseudarthrobacter sp. S9 TaxID=3418421 RepID=UPI003D02CCF7
MIRRRPVAATGSEQVKIGFTAGLHARPASAFVNAGAASEHDVTISFGTEDRVDASSLSSVLALGIEYGDEVTLHVDGDRAQEALNELGDLLRRNLD